MSDGHERKLDYFYQILADLAARVGRRRLADCNGRMAWPRRGVYFFFERGEFRRDGVTPRVARVGTHAVSKGSKTTLWSRLSAHRGTGSGGGNHRASIFRLHVGGALLDSNDALQPKPKLWGVGHWTDRDIRGAESQVEQAVSTYIRAMPFLWVEADDEPGSSSIRRVIERNSIALLSRNNPTGNMADPPSGQWLGRYARSEAVRRSGLWNVSHTEDEYDPGFLEPLSECAGRTRLLC
jgi:hypothetical protein